MPIARFKRVIMNYGNVLFRFCPTFRTNLCPYSTLYGQLQETIKNLATGTTTSSLHAPTASVRKSLKREDVPNVKYFYQWDYTNKLKHSRARAAVLDPGASSSKQKGGTRLASNNENVQMDYIEDENGVVVNGDTAKQIRGLARSILIEIDSVDSMKLPPSWSSIGITERTYFVKQMYEHYPILGLCDNDWKVHYLASRALSTYHEHLKRKEKAAAIKSEPKETNADVLKTHYTEIDPTVQDLPCLVKRKSPSSSSEAHPAKRPRPTAPSPAPTRTTVNAASALVSMPTGVPNAPFSLSPSPLSPLRSLLPASPYSSLPPLLLPHPPPTFSGPSFFVAGSVGLTSTISINSAGSRRTDSFFLPYTSCQHQFTSSMHPSFCFAFI